jgi:ABC-2 type transport system permease protein
LRLAAARLRSDMQYRTSFALMTAIAAAFSFLDFVAVTVIFTNIGDLAGWTFTEVAVLYGTSGVSFNLANVFVAGVDRASAHIRAGTFDVLLLRPVGTITQLTAGDIEPRRAGRVVQAALVLAIALDRVPVDWTPARALMIPVLLASGAAIFSGLWIAAAAIAFWTIENRALANTVTYSGNYLTLYPLDVFTSWLRHILAIIPLAFVNYLPVAWILGKDTAYHWPSWAPLTTPAVAVATSLTARHIWRTGIRRYRSTGS